MFGNNSDFIPRTYSIKSFRRRKPDRLRMLLVYFIYFLLAAIVIGIVYLKFVHKA